MEALTQMEVVVMIVLSKRGGSMRLGELARKQPEKGIMRQGRLEKSDAYRARRKKKRIAALDGLILKGMLRRLVQWQDQPGPNPTIYQVTARGVVWMREHGTRTTVVVPT